MLFGYQGKGPSGPVNVPVGPFTTCAAQIMLRDPS